MVGQLRRLSAISAALRSEIEKEAAGILGAATKGMAAVGAIGAAQSAAGKAKKVRSGFDPEVQKQMLGTPPAPPSPQG